MKIATGIAGILLGIFSLTYIGIYGSMIGSAVGWVRSLFATIPSVLGPRWFQCFRGWRRSLQL
jgi:hypothetical protein